ncbi:MAG TPA: MoaD/ThiS family protein [Gammaproteobacteria bacterium]|jgi:molybdopterin converting factor small subunit|nr:MoaD/ThiS family protein [Gammaproteobacteria bacterium]
MSADGASDRQIGVECYGVLQQVCGGRERRVSVAGLPATVADVLEGLARDVPDARRYLQHTACAIGDRIVQRDARLEAGDTLVLLPPVSGG